MLQALNKKWFFGVLIGLSILEFAIAIWNEFYNNGSLLVLLLSCFAFGLVVTLWNIFLSIRKSRHLRKLDTVASKAHTRLAVYNTFFCSGQCLIPSLSAFLALQASGHISFLYGSALWHPSFFIL
jgi:hypothetical protein